MSLPPLDLHSATFPPDGGLSGEGAARVLGRPEKLDPLGVLIHETVQNSWDAAVSRYEIPVAFSIRGWSLGGAEIRALRKTVFPSTPPQGLPLGDVLKQRSILAFCIGDTGTVGLGGPVRMDRTPAEGQPTDYVDFVFAVGSPQDREKGGGTYGFGKTISYLISRARTVIIYTRTRQQGRAESRLIAAAIGNQFARGGRRHTGRHWWGRVTSDGVVEPVTGRDADEIADEIGMGAFGSAETGTRILILEPELGLRSPLQAMNHMAESLLWYAWPLLTTAQAGGDGAPLTCHFSWEDREVELADPSTHPQLSHYVRALQAVRTTQADGKVPPPVDVYEVDCLRPIQLLGHVGIQLGSYEPPIRRDEGKDEEGNPASAAPFDDRSHHVALMRGPELVVDYLEGPAIQNGAWQWAGVFRTVPEVEDAFAEAEPPTHDAWNPSMVMDSRRKRFVNVGLRRIRELTNERFQQVGRPSHTQAESAAVIADQLAHLLLGIPGNRPTPDSPRQPSGGGRRRARRSRLTIEDHRLRPKDGVVVREFDFRLDREPGTWVRVEADVAVLIAGGGRETEPPADEGAVTPVGFRRRGAPGPPRQGTDVWIAPEDGDEWTFLTEGPSGVAVVVDLRIAEEEGSDEV